MFYRLLPCNKYELIMVVSLIVFIMGLFARVNYISDLINHFRPYLILIFACIFIYQCLKSYKNKLLAYLAIGFLLNIYAFPDFPSFFAQNASGSQIRIMHFNLLARNSNYDKTINLIRANHPNVISFQEATFAWSQILIKQLTEYTFVCEPIDSPFGICAAFNIPIVEDSIFYLQDQNVPGIEVKAKVENQNISFVFIHPKPPFNPPFFEQRNFYFEELTNKIKNYDNLIIVGDLNITQWSPIYCDFEKKLGLKNTLSGFDNTWPSFLPFKIFQLDHIMYSKNLKLIHSQVLENIGSDHYPILSQINI